MPADGNETPAVPDRFITHVAIRLADDGKPRCAALLTVRYKDP